MADEKAMENEIARAVETELEPIGKSADRVLRNLRPVAGEPGSMERWIKLGERLHDETTERLSQERAEYESLHAEVVEKLRRLKRLQGTIGANEALLMSIRHHLGYSR